MHNDFALIAIISFATLLPFLVASGTCYIKFSIVFNIVRNALGLQQVPSNMVLNAVALMLSCYIMMPIGQEMYNTYQQQNVSLDSAQSIVNFIDQGTDGYRSYLQKYSDPDLVAFFEKAAGQRPEGAAAANADDGDVRPSIMTLLPAYALSEIKSAFTIGFYIYLPFVVVDLVISSILLSLGMMMMSPVTISVPVKLVLFVAMDGWGLLSRGLVQQYLSIHH
ncbi:EscR/YscR/HrcR family type III secretion system export apparatus protein [Paludibacterium paludis]|uniref:EscR/YscR/HrcR family type III secretion system export apparatus protein n=1 Tax=Paludibacterium paludis TaxID=1225769 RepID=A0A918P6T7_9NEIS|nr:EscR/YscR/HrcR family type III secretion system export apparatus protein [Paludibacterium paludis]GGY23972.1 EscR/YscR/HrcR family type III secretion system export apparatus protein [Paludibacterium paludis]